MEATAPKQMAAANPMSLAKFMMIKSVMIIGVCVILGVAQAWMASRSYKPNQVAGFCTGIWHGALMPAALPGLLIGNNLPIYAPNNTGRSYNIGYILGINACGAFFFGAAFWRPRGWRWDRARAKHLS